MDYLAGNGAQGADDFVNQQSDATSTGGVGPNLAGTTATDVFDLSSYDPLQQYVMQLTASLGYAHYAPAPDQYEVQQPQQQSQEQPQQPPQQQQPQQQQYYYIPQQQQQQQQQEQGFTFPQPAAYKSVSQPGTFVNASSTQQSQSYIPSPLGPVAPLAPKPLSPAYASSQSGKRPRPNNEQATNKKQQMGYYPSLPSVISNNAAFDNDDCLDKKLPPNWASMRPEERRRWERNIREQQRSQRISEHIEELRTVLTDSNVPFKPNKHSILLSVADYIRQLQSRAIMLDAEHRKLIDTIRQTSETVDSGQVPEPEASFEDKEEGKNNEEMLFVQGLDYKSVFDQGTAAMGIAALDGRILACNHEFVNALGYSREELLRLSLFSVMQNHEEVFRAMGEMLKAESFIDGLDQDEEKQAMYWSGIVSQSDRSQLSLSITLTRSADGLPKFFNCALNAT